MREPKWEKDLQRNSSSVMIKAWYTEITHSTKAITDENLNSCAQNDTMHPNWKGIPYFAGGLIFQGSNREEGCLDIISLTSKRKKIGSGTIMLLQSKI